MPQSEENQIAIGFSKFDQAKFSVADEFLLHAYYAGMVDFDFILQIAEHQRLIDLNAIS